MNLAFYGAGRSLKTPSVMSLVFHNLATALPKIYLKENSKDAIETNQSYHHKEPDQSSRTEVPGTYEWTEDVDVKITSCNLCPFQKIAHQSLGLV